jgi:signal transduction histidine kinase
LESILVSGRHLLGLINGMLDLAKVESGRMDFVPAHVDLAGIVVEATEAVRSLASRKHLHLSTEIEESLGAGVLDAARLKQVLFNLLSNAIKFTDNGGRVLMRARALEETKILLEVEDSGIGIRDSDLPRLFVEFSQLESGLDKRYEGTGLGLVLTQRIVKAMGGEVSVRSRFGHGSVFGIVVPRVHPTPTAPNVESKLANTAEARRIDGAYG